MADAAEQAQIADTVVLSHDGDEDTEHSLQKPSYIRYLQRSKTGPVAVGDVWEEFVNCGCGTTEDVQLRVEGIEGGTAIGETTNFRFERR